MGEMQLWQSVVVGTVAAGAILVMSRSIIEMFSRRSAVMATERRATPLESALIGAGSPEDVVAFDAFAYRVAARFAGKTRIVVSPDSVSVSGPRVPRPLYRAWIWGQGLLLAIVPAFAVWALVTVSWPPLVLALLTLLVSFGVSILGAGLWPGLGETEFLVEGAYKALEFPRKSVSDVAVGEGWSRGGMDMVLLPYRKGVDAMAGESAVSFFAPDEHGGLVRYALHVPDVAKAAELAQLLRAGAAES